MNKTKFAALLATLVSGMQVNTSFALDAVAAQNAINNGVSTLAVLQDRSEGSWGEIEGLEFIYTASVVDALRSADQRSGTYYSGIAWLENHYASNVDSKSRKISGLLSRGNNIQLDIDLIIAAKRESAQSGWGLSGGYYSSPLDTALTLQAFNRAEVSTGVNSAVSYLVDSRLSDGGWGINGATASDYWVTAEVAIALDKYSSHSGVNSALSAASNYLAAANHSSLDTSVLARVALALFELRGLDSITDATMTVLLARQTNGDWGGVLATANAVTALSYAIGLNLKVESAVVTVDQEQLRTAINETLGHAAYGKITQADVQSLTSLDLRSADIANLEGLQGASNLSQIQVNAFTDISAISGLSGLTVIIDSDFDNIVDASDNCPFVSNASQANLDGDAFGDVCDSDIDGDTMPNTWEETYALNPNSAGDATGDPDNDQLINRDEYAYGSNPRDPDTDSDTIIDGLEVANGLDPVDPDDADLDPDLDSLTNAEEIAIGTDINDPDTDSDNLNDGDELAVGRNPLLNEPALIVIVTGLLLN